MKQLSEEDWPEDQTINFRCVDMHGKAQLARLTYKYVEIKSMKDGWFLSWKMNCTDNWCTPDDYGSYHGAIYDASDWTHSDEWRYPQDIERTGWEYMNTTKEECGIIKLNELGAEGWELCSSDEFIYVLKRVLG